MNRAASIRENLRIGERFNQWVLEFARKRRGTTRFPLAIQYHHIYVMPTRFGAWFAMLLVLVIVGGLNFNNNMTLLLGFLVASIALLTTLLVYRNQEGMIVNGILAKPVFCGEVAQFRVLLKNSGPRHRFAIQAVSEESVDCTDIEPDDSRALEVRQQTWKRGWMELDPFRIENRFPIGLFRAWSVIIPDIRCLVYPEPSPNPPPLPKTGRGDTGRAHRGDGDHFHGLREYKRGDSMHRIAWRASARHGKLYAKEMETPRDEACELNWYLMGGRDSEEKLGIMTAWVLRAERHQIPYSLEMPGFALPSDLGEEHRDACLKTLALFKP